MAILFTQKLNMEAQYAANGDFVSVTALKVLPAEVAGTRTVAKHGYQANVFSVAWGKQKKLKEVRSDELLEIASSQALATFQVGDSVKLSGISKGHGFSGVVKRHGFKGGPRTHGQSDRERAPGASSSGTTLGRLLKGKRMAGRMGNAKITLKKVKIVNVDIEKQIIYVKGAVPGSARTMITLSKI